MVMKKYLGNHKGNACSISKINNMRTSCILKRTIVASVLSSILVSCTKNTPLLESASNGSETTEQTQLIKPASDGDSDLMEASLVMAGWTKVFSDDFNTLDIAEWKIWESGAYNNELQLYQASSLQVINGVLQINAVVEPSPVSGATSPGNPVLKNFDYTSGRIESIRTFSANAITPDLMISARMKLPAGYGLWPAFWTLGNDPWPTNGEIDIMEARVDALGVAPTQYQTNYFYGTAANVNLVSGAERWVPSPGVNLTTSYHDYAIKWSHHKLKFYFDGVLVDTKFRSDPSGVYIPDLFGKDQHITFNLAVGGDFIPGLVPANIQPGSMYVKWVKVFAK
jgi:beta-glucanase (GH16 family)